MGEIDIFLKSKATAERLVGPIFSLSSLRGGQSLGCVPHSKAQISFGSSPTLIKPDVTRASSINILYRIILRTINTESISY